MAYPSPYRLRHYGMGFRAATRPLSNGAYECAWTAQWTSCSGGSSGKVGGFLTWYTMRDRFFSGVAAEYLVCPAGVTALLTEPGTSVRRQGECKPHRLCTDA